MDDEKIKELYEKYPDTKSKITVVSYMRKPLSERKWISGKRWAQDFVKYSGFPQILAGVSVKREEIKRSIQVIEPKRKVPELVDYQVLIKDKILSTLNLELDKTRCMISLPTGGGKTRVAVEAFLDWMIPKFENEKYMI